MPRSVTGQNDIGERLLIADLELVSGCDRLQRTAQAPQKMSAMKVSQIEMPAMREALMQMPNGAKWEITLPADRAYGADPRTGFPPNMAGVFEVKPDRLT